MTEYTDPKTRKKDAMLSNFYSSTNRTPMKAFKAARQALGGEVTAMGALGAKAGKRAAQALGAMPGVGRPKKKKKKKNGPY